MEQHHTEQRLGHDFSVEVTMDGAHPPARIPLELFATRGGRGNEA
jgi:hypothetical protein